MVFPLGIEKMYPEKKNIQERQIFMNTSILANYRLPFKTEYGISFILLVFVLLLINQA